ncbi:sulfatase [Halosquirtibacter xylanolyticus]|uniref:sulfatase n=1 Tax=Halosquirtibacter xylanolyticus TaxID=3374599 RepID=UPI00374A5B75|nr:sulfatase [Prolixibacteraceae bacterium]
MKNIRLLKTLIALLMLSSTQIRAEKKPNVIVFLVDDLGYKDLGYTGSSFYETPNIDKVANEGIIFNNGYAGASNCAPSRACLLSGQNTPRHGIYTVKSSERGNVKTRKIIPTPNTLVLQDKIQTLGNLFSTNGYKTISLGKWHVSNNPLTQGFDENVAGCEMGNPGRKGYFAPYNVPKLEPKKEHEYLTDRLTDEAIGFIDRNQDNPFFVYLSYYSVHSPLMAKDSLVKKYKHKMNSPGQSNANYAGMIETVDTNMGKLISALKQRGLLENTLIIFTSDNGGVRKTSYQDPLRAGKGSYYEGGIRVPFFAYWKGKIRGHRVSDLPVVNMDIYATCKALVKDNNRQVCDGRSLLPLLVKGDKLSTKPLFWHFPIYLESYAGKIDQARDVLFRTRPGTVVRYGNWKLHYYYEDNKMELYNLISDIGERNNLKDKYPEKCHELYEMIKTWRENLHAPVPITLNPEYNAIVEKEMLEKRNNQF